MKGLKRFPLFGDLGDEEIALLGELLEPFALGAGEALMTLGDRADGAVLLSHGRVRVEGAPEGAGTWRVEAPCVLGAASLVAVGQRPATWLAEGACRGWTLSRTAFHRFSEDAPRAALRVLEAVVCDLSSLVRAGIDAKR